jgi:5-methylcytosine-specific restriction endonuclease McrA
MTRRERKRMNRIRQKKFIQDRFPTKAEQEKTSFYHSDSWRFLRYQAIKKYGRVCACCGETEGKIHVDNIKPRSLFPHLELNLSNLQILCESCNLGKGNTDSIDWREKNKTFSCFTGQQ